MMSPSSDLGVTDLESPHKHLERRQEIRSDDTFKKITMPAGVGVVGVYRIGTQISLGDIIILQIRCKDGEQQEDAREDMP
jgi:hypothetical protein